MTVTARSLLRHFSVGAAVLFSAMGTLVAPVATAQTTTYTSNTVQTYDDSCTITQTNTAAGNARIAINVPDAFTIADVDVGFIVDHFFRLDSEVWLTSPAGTRVQLLTGPAPNNQIANYNVLFDEEEMAEVGTGASAGDHTVGAAFPEFSVRPEDGAAGSLSDFDGESSNGTWFVDFCDNFPALDDGTISRSELRLTSSAPPTDADLSLALSASTLTPTEASGTFFDVTVTNSGGLDTSGVTVNVTLPAGLIYTSDNSGGEFDSGAGLWTIPGTLAAGATDTFRIFATVQVTGPYTVSADIAASAVSDPDSTPGNASTTEDDDDTLTFTPQPAAVPIFCLGRPIVPLVFQNPVAETVGANPNNPQLNDVFRFPNVVAGADALVRVAAFNNGGSLLTIDDSVNGLNDNFQPTLLGGAGEVSVDFEISIVATGDTAPATIDFAGSTVDVDGGGGLREYVEVSNNIVESAVDQNTALGIDASGPSSPNRVRFEVLTETQAPNGAISVDPGHIAVAFFTDVSVFEYRIGKFGGALGGAGRLNSLAFDCPAITPAMTNPVADEDFGDAPFDLDPAARPNYGNPVHVVASGVQLGATNTPDLAPGDSANASSDTGDDGVTLPASFQGLVQSSTITVSVQGNGYLQGFFDWNGDGDFEDAGEQPIVDVQDTNLDGTITLTVTPPGNTVTGTSFARFRWSTASGVGIQDPAGDGEVEDYQISLVEAINADLSVGLSFTNTLAAVNSQVTATVTLTNDGPAESNAVTVSFPFPANTTYVSDTGNGAFDEINGVITLPSSLPSGQSVTIDITFSVDAIGDLDFLTEILTAERPDPDSTPGNSGTIPAEDDTATGTVTVSNVVAVLTGSKTNALFDPGSTGNVLAIPGNDVVYTITINNTGNGPADPNSIELIDLMPTEMAFYNGDADDDVTAGVEVVDVDLGTSSLTFDPATDLGFSFLDPSTPPADFSACSDPLPSPTPPNVQASVNFICFNPKGAMAAGSTITVSFRARIE